MMAERALEPIRDEIRADLLWMTRRWGELSQPVMLELRALAENRQPQTARFKADWIDGAVDWAASVNKAGMNVYAVRNPVREGVSGSASDPDIVAAFFLWADCDDAASSENVRNFVGPKWTASVITGTTPSTRVHVYFELTEPTLDMDAWRNMQDRIAAHLKSDQKVKNPSRVMRVGGTVTFPDKNKRDRGYISEVSTIRTYYSEPRTPVTMDQMERAFAPRLSQLATPSGFTFQIDTGGGYGPVLDREQMRIQALSGKEWHDAVIRLVGSYVNRGLADGEIHALTDPLTLAGYTVEETRKEVQAAIDGARRKGWTPAQDFTPNFDHAPAPTPSDPAPKVQAWQVQRADAFTADFVAPEYIVDGIIQRGRVYTLTAPTGSGKTAVMLYAATAIATGGRFCAQEVEAGDVLFMAGENPDDVRARTIATMEYYKIDPANCRLHFIAGTFSIRADLERLREEAAKLPNLILVVVDTFAAYFDGDDENSNAQALDFTRVIRRVAAFDAKPAIIMPAHPVKNATRGNLTPKGGSSLLNEVDGNLTLWKEADILTMHWQGKFRGAEFEPLQMELQRYETPAICDNQGRIIPTILAKPLSMTRAMDLATENLSREDKTLLTIESQPALSIRDRCVAVGVVTKDGKALTSTMKRLIDKLIEQKLVRRFRTNLELTKDGERAVEMLHSGQPFAKEI
jgi:AAA domain